MRNWTTEQERAITMRDRTILLSAAAGSGKTAVLTERTIRALTDEEHPLELNRLLAVTFTRAAARELRERIGAALAEQVRRHPTDPRLARQLRLLPTAKICTIDSFCGDLVRRFATRIGISDGYRVADQQETDLTRISLMEDLLEDAYAGNIPDLSADTFASFVTRLYALKEEGGMGETLLALFERMETLARGVDALADFADSYRRDAETPLSATAWGRSIRALAAEIGNHFLTSLDAAVAAAYPTPDTREKYENYLSDYRAVMYALAAPDTTYASLQEAISHAFLRAASGLDSVVKEVCDEFRTDYIKGGKLSKLLSYTEAEWKTLFEDLADACTTLHLLAREFSRRESRESRRRGVYSFAQIERLAYSLLVENGERTPLAVSLSEEYDAVSVDEYQDVSPLQHAVFAAIAGERCRFLVGDIKQSIYRFRHADPTIFADLRRSFPSPDEAPDSPTASLFMSLNFRCDAPVVAYVNHVFDTLFGVCGESIGYTDGDRLGFGKGADGVTLSVTPTLAVFESAANGVAPVSEGATWTNGLPDAAHVAGGDANPLPEGDEEDDLEDARDIHTEAMWVAGTIRDLIDNATLHDGVTPIKPSDIAVLLRSKRGKVLPYIEALHAFGIPAETPEATDFFSCPEVLLALSLLRTIDNPRRDIPLAAVLLSPLYRLSADDLTLIRRESPEGIPLYDALVHYSAAHPEFERGHAFLTQLASFRDAAEDISVDRLLRRVMTETPLLAIAGADGGGGENKIRLLYHYALRFESGDAGLYSFIHYINRQIETGKTFTPPAAPGKTAGVSVMTIHSSKGLEFPVVFLADCGKTFSNLDTRNHFVFDGTHPVAFRLRDKTGLIRVDNPVREIVNLTTAEENAEEEMRLLYVALTRARERLYLSGTLPARKKFDDVWAAAEEDARDTTRFRVMRRNSYLSMLLLAQARCADFATLSVCPDLPTPPAVNETEEACTACNPDDIARLADEYRRRFAYTYPHEILTRIPGKLSVSRLTPTLLDGTEEETAYLDTLPAEHTLVTPAAEEVVDTAERYRRMPEAWAGAQPPDPTERGIVSHKFMQFCDFDRLVTDGVEAELTRLIDAGYLNREETALVRMRELELFRTSSLISLMREAKEVKREFRFHAHLPASRFSADPRLTAELADERLLVQGVMDALIIDGMGDITLVDYKTDRLTREELADPRLAEEKLRRRHASQLGYYAAAIEQIFGKPPKSVLIYSLHLGRSIDLRID